MFFLCALDMAHIRATISKNALSFAQKR